MSTESIDTIEQLLKQYEDGVKHILFDNGLDTIDDYEMKLNHYINNLEYSNNDKTQKLFYYYKSKFLKIKYSYLKMSNKPNDAKRIENLLAEYEPLLFETFLRVNEESVEVETNSNPYMDCVQYLLSKKIIKNPTAKKLVEFSEYKEMVLNKLDEFTMMTNIYNELIIEIYNVISSFDLVENENEQSRDSLAFLFSVEEYLNNLRVEFTVGFIVHTQSVSKPEQILFANIDVQNAESIRKHYHKLLLKFHMDKMQNWFPLNKKELIEDFFRLIEKCKNIMLGRLNESTMELADTINDYELRAYEYYKYSCDYRKCFLKKWSDDFKILKKTEIPSLLPKEFQNLSQYFALRSYKEYKNACKLADRYNFFEKQLKLRESMALCLYMADKVLEAQLIAISQIFLMEKFKKGSGTQKDQLRKLLSKLYMIPQNSDIFASTSSATISSTAAPMDADQSLKNALILLDNNNDGSSDLDLSNNVGFKRDIQNMLILLADRDNIKVDVHKRSIIEIKSSRNKKIKAYSAAGGTLALGTAGAALAFLGEAKEIITVTAFGTIMGGPILGITTAVVSSLATILITGIGARSVWKKETEKLNKKIKEIKACENLNEILTIAIQQHDTGNFKEFLEALSKPFDDDGNRLLNINDDSVDIDAKKIITILLQLHSTPDAIACLLNLIVNALLSGKLNLHLDFFTILQSKALEILKQISCEELEKRAVELDTKVTIYRRTIRKVSGCFNKFCEVMGFYKCQTDETHEKAAENAANKGSSHCKLLSEMKIVAKINAAILSLIMAGNNGGDKAAEVYLEEIKSLVNNSESYLEGEIGIRLELLEFIYWIFTSREPPNVFDVQLRILPNTDITFSSNDTLNGPVPDDSLNYYDFLIEKTKDKKEKIEYLNRKANIIYQRAENLEAQQERTEYFADYKRAQLVYKNSFSLNETANEAGIQILKCYVKLKMFKKAREFCCQLVNSQSEMIVNEFYDKSADYWLYSGIALRYLNDFSTAKHYLMESLKLSQSDLALKELSIIDRLINKSKEIKTIDEQIEMYKQDGKRYENFNLKNDKSKMYKIVSIDGGGIRGILPAMLLCEIERRSYMPMINMTNLFAGTSTGALIAAGLSMPQTETSSKPLFYACDLFEMYVKRAKDIFKNSSSLLAGVLLNRPKYADSNRYDFFKYIAGGKDRYLNESLCDLIITAVKDKHYKYLFTSHDAIRNRENNHSIIDALMATTAAPTFFLPYSIQNVGEFYDGGVLMNNPSGVAYHEAVYQYGIDPKSIYVLSLGTGNYVSDPYDLDKSKSILYWAQNIPDIMICGQQNTEDNKMKDLLQDRYTRWQIYLDTPIALDDVDNIVKLYDAGRQFIEEQDDSINKIVEMFSKEQ